MKHRIFRKCTAILLAICMVMSLMVTAYAADESKPELYYVAFGDSTSAGYGMNATKDKDGYDIEDVVTYYTEPKGTTLNNEGKFVNNTNTLGWERKVTWSYPTLINDALSEVYGKGNVEYHPMPYSGFRMEDLHYMLDNTYGNDSWGKKRFAESNLKDVIKNAGLNAGDKTATEFIREQFQSAAAQADLITIDLGMNNFGTYVTERLMLRQEYISSGLASGKSGSDLQGFVENKLVEQDLDQFTNEEKAAGAALGTAAKEAILAGFGITALGEYTAAQVFQAAVDQNASMLPLKILIDGLVSDVEYGYMGFCKHFDATMERINVLNPDVHVVVIGVYNSMVGVKLSVDENNSFDLGEIWDDVMAAANAYSSKYTVPEESSMSYQYIDLDECLNGGRVELFFDELTAAYDVFDGIDGDYEAEKETLGVNMYDLLSMLVDSVLNGDDNELLASASVAISGMADKDNSEKITLEVEITNNITGSIVLTTSDVNNALTTAVGSAGEQSVSAVIAPTMGAILDGAVIDLNALLTGNWSAGDVMDAFTEDITAPIAYMIVNEFVDNLTELIWNSNISILGGPISISSSGQIEKSDIRSIVEKEIQEALGTDYPALPDNYKPAGTLTPDEKSLLALYLRFIFADGLMVHPNEAGYEQMANAVLDSLSFVSEIAVSETALNREGGKVTVTVKGYGLVNDLNVSAVCGEKVISGITYGSDTEQTVELTLPENEGNDTMTYEVACNGQTVNVAVTTTETVPEAMSVAFKSLSLTLEGDIAINFYALVDEQNYSSAYDVGALIWFENYGNAEAPVMNISTENDKGADEFDNEDRNDPYRRTARYSGVDDDDMHMFTVGNIAAKEMGDKVYIIPYIVTADGSTIYGAEKAFSVYDVANLVLNSDDQEFKNLANALIAYGKAAEVYFTNN